MLHGINVIQGKPSSIIRGFVNKKNYKCGLVVKGSLGLSQNNWKDIYFLVFFQLIFAKISFLFTALAMSVHTLQFTILFLDMGVGGWVKPMKTRLAYSFCVYLQNPLA